MLKTSRNLMLLALVAGLTLAAPQAFAKKKGDAPAGWSKGEKKGWGGESLPPGLAKKDADKAKKEAGKPKKEAEKKTKMAKKEAAKKSG